MMNILKNRATPGWLRALLVLIWPTIALFAATPANADPFSSCPAGPNQIRCENALPGDPESDWQINGNGDDTIQGYATQMSVTPGQTVSFKINTPSSKYHINILRLGYYGGDGARMIQSGIKPTATLPQTQPACLTASSTGLVDCGNWSVSASWAVPSDAISGLYIALLVRDDSQDPGGTSQIPFVVRNDASHSAIVDQLSDATWEAYNTYGGGNSLYGCSIVCPPGNPLTYKGAFAVSYNRPFTFTDDGGIANPYYAEYEMIRFLEANGYDVSYIASADTDRSGSLLTNHKIFLSVGHDEYWSGQQRANVQAALNAGVNLGFFSGNEVFWKTRWSSSIDGSNTPYRTLVSYKETHFNGPVDPQDPPTWTGTWADPRFSPPADGGLPPNQLTGQMFNVNEGTAAIKVPFQYSKTRFWRNTAVAKLTSGQTLTLAPNTLGYEWDQDVDNGFRPAGEFDLSSTTVSGLQTFTDYGSITNNSDTQTHNLSLYRAASGALVFGAGTVQWSWGLDADNPNNQAADKNIQQATVNLFADMGVQPQSLLAGLVAASASGDHTAPTSTISSPTAGATFQDGAKVTISGSATDSGGGIVTGVEVSTDGGTTWHPAQITTPDGTTVSWSYSWIASGAPSANIKTRAVDDSANLETPSSGISVNVNCPCSLWAPNIAPAQADGGDGASVEVGVKFQSTEFGQITGVRFYKATTNTGTHIGSLWTSTGQLLASATFTGESVSGWQSVTFSSPVTILPNTTYVAGYFAPSGHYSAGSSYFYPAPAPNPLGGAVRNSPPLKALTNDQSPNGVYAYSGTSTFPTNSYGASNYWVDVSFSPSPPPGPASGVSATAGKGSATVTWSAPTTGGPVTSYKITPYIGSQAQASTTINGTPPATSATVTGLTPNQSYTFTVTASNPAGSAAASASSNSVTPQPLTVPGAPTNVSAIPASSQASVSWSAPSDDGGTPLTGYTLTVYNGATLIKTMNVSANQTGALVTGLGTDVAYTFKLAATNNIGSSDPSAATATATPEDTIFDFGTPAQIDSFDGGSVTLGMKFTADLGGSITGLRFYKAAANTGTHAVGLWTTSGQLLASATASAESASGWQTVLFANPVTISAGTTYIAGYDAPNGHYSATPQGFASGVDNSPLHAPSSSASGGNGVYQYGGGLEFPSNTYNATNYWVDVLFAPTPLPGKVTNVSGTSGNGSVDVSWSAPSSGGPVSKYTVTPYLSGVAQAATTVTGTPLATSVNVDLTPGQTYTFTVQASNVNGNGPASDPSPPATAGAQSVPSAPTGVSAMAASGQARVSWNVPSDDGGTPITSYTVTPYIGTNAQPPVQVSGASTTSTTVTGLTTNTPYTFAVTATNAIGTSPASAASASVTPEDTLFDFSTPTTVDSGDTGSIELGVKFTASVNGEILGLRFYKAATNTGTHIGNLWTTGGAQLASGTFSNESASGWQTLIFSSPVQITAGTTYVASYFAPNGHYSSSGGAFNTIFSNPPLQAPDAGTTPNGVYQYSSSSTFPTSNFNATNYWVDVLFAPN
jgi:hypothetical protein